jgi:hypothetical protein
MNGGNWPRRCSKELLRRKMKKLEDLVAADFPECDPKKFEAWKRAEVSFQKQRWPHFFGLGVAIMMFSIPLVRYLSGVHLARGVALMIGAVLAVSFWLWYAYTILRISPKGKAIKKLYKDTGIHWKTLCVTILTGTNR